MNTAKRTVSLRFHQLIAGIDHQTLIYVSLSARGRLAKVYAYQNTRYRRRTTNIGGDPLQTFHAPDAKPLAARQRKLAVGAGLLVLHRLN